MANDIHKIKLLVLWDILCQNTDEEHALNTDEIVELLALRGINVSRKILVEDIKTFDQSIEEHVEEYIENGLTTKDAIKAVAKERGLSKNIVYNEYHKK